MHSTGVEKGEMNMTDKANDKELDALKADIARLREEVAGLVAGVKKTSKTHAEQPHTTPQQEGPTHYEEGHGVWADLLHKLDSSRIQGEKVFKGLATEVEQRPLVSVLAAFGLGYVIAKLWYQEKNNEHTNDAP
jgi:hypothetical protein